MRIAINNQKKQILKDLTGEVKQKKTSLVDMGIETYRK